MRSQQEIEKKIEELHGADLDKMPVDEVEYGMFWLQWVLGKEEHVTRTRQCLSTHGAAGYAPGSLALPDGSVRCGACGQIITNPRKEAIRPDMGR